MALRLKCKVSSQIVIRFMCVGGLLKVVLVVFFRRYAEGRGTKFSNRLKQRPHHATYSKSNSLTLTLLKLGFSSCPTCTLELPTNLPVSASHLYSEVNFAFSFAAM